MFQISKILFGISFTTVCSLSSISASCAQEQGDANAGLAQQLAAQQVEVQQVREGERPRIEVPPRGAPIDQLKPFVPQDEFLRIPFCDKVPPTTELLLDDKGLLVIPPEGWNIEQLDLANRFRTVARLTFAKIASSLYENMNIKNFVCPIRCREQGLQIFSADLIGFGSGCNENKIAGVGQDWITYNPLQVEDSTFIEVGFGIRPLAVQFDCICKVEPIF